MSGHTDTITRYAFGMRVIVASDVRAMAARTAELICETVGRSPDATIGLPSARTPLAFYDQLVRRVSEGVADFSRVAAFAIDELHGVPRSHPATNASYFERVLAGRVRLRALHIMNSEAADPAEECARFRRLMVEEDGLDLVILGIGLNGHIAFNEPGSSFDSHARPVDLAPATRQVYESLFDSPRDVPSVGLTLGIADLLAAPRVLLLASGQGKAEIVARAVQGPVTETLPASALQRHADLTVVLDPEAASRLTNP